MKELTELLEKLADKLGTTVEHLWEVTTKQAEIVYYEYLGYTVIAVLFLISAIWMIDFSWTGLVNLQDVEYKWLSGVAEKEIGYTIGLVLSIIWCVIAPFVLVRNIKELLTLKQNPEYWALQEILSQLIC